MSEHKNTHGKKLNIWKIASLALAVLLVASVFTNGFMFNTNIDTVINDLNTLNSKQNSQQVKTQINNAVSSLNSAKRIISGEVGNKLLIEVFSDFQCPYSARAFPTVQQIKANYAGQIDLVFKHFPLSFHPNAQKASEASECARDQGKFWEYHDKLFQNQQAIAVDNLKKYASDLGLDTSKFNSCLDSSQKAGVVSQDMQEGISKGVSGTPTFFINGQKVVGAVPYETIKATIDAELAKV